MEFSISFAITLSYDPVELVHTLGRVTKIINIVVKLIRVYVINQIRKITVVHQEDYSMNLVVLSLDVDFEVSLLRNMARDISYLDLRGWEILRIIKFTVLIPKP